MGVTFPVVPPSTPGTSGSRADLADHSAVFAHGLLNTLAVLSMAAGTLLSFRDALGPSVRDDLVNTIVLQSALLGEGLVFALEHGSESFNNAAASIVDSAVLLKAAPNELSAAVMADLVADCLTVGAGLDSLVRGLPDEVVVLLDGSHHNS